MSMPAPRPIAPDTGAPTLLEPLLAVHSAANVSWLADAAATAAERGLGALYSVLYLSDASGQLAGVRPASRAASRALTRLHQALEMDVTQLRLDPDDLPAVRTALAEGRAVAVSDLSHAIPQDGDPERIAKAQRQLGISAVWLVPLRWEGENAGLLVLLMGVAAPAQLACAELLGSHAAVALRNLREEEAGRKRGEVDAVRWIYDERRIWEELEQESRRALRHKRPLSVLLLRVLNIDELRARYGRFLGDRILRQVAGRLEGAMRDTDFLGASQENGFAAILVETDEDGAERAEERLSAGLQEMSLPHTDLPDLRIELACATATLPQDGESAEELVAAAEARLQSRRIIRQEAASAG
jgi:diguanylate cyclase (GGDEF)-like protein